MGSALYAEGYLQRLFVQHGLWQQLLVPVVLGVQLAQPFGVAGLHAAELGLPLVER